jgi:hypothetical protein
MGDFFAEHGRLPNLEKSDAKEGPSSVFKGFVQGRGMKIFVPGLRALNDTPKSPDSEFNEGPRGLSLVRPAARDVQLLGALVPSQRSMQADSAADRFDQLGRVLSRRRL